MVLHVVMVCGGFPTARCGWQSPAIGYLIPPALISEHLRTQTYITLQMSQRIAPNSKTSFSVFNSSPQWLGLVIRLSS